MAETTAVVATFRHRHTAELARGFLEDADIAAVVTVDDGGGSFAGLTMNPNPARLMVRPADAERARTVLSDAGMLADDGDG